MSIKENLKLKTLFVAHDVGGANLLISLSRKFESEVYFVFAGPASKLLIDSNKNYVDDKISLSKFRIEQIITGTSAESNLELEYLKFAQNHSIPSVSVLDNWSNYIERFFRNGELTLPKSIWVCDDYAFKKARLDFQNLHLKLIPNFYINEILMKVSPLERSINLENAQRILYFCEPPGPKALNVNADPRFVGYSESEALTFFLSNLKKVFPSCKQLTFRTHPSNAKFPIKLSSIQLDEIETCISKVDLASDISNADIVVGTNSMALYIGMLARRIAISAIPPNGYPCTIPDDRIIDLNSLLV